MPRKGNIKKLKKSHKKTLNIDLSLSGNKFNRFIIKKGQETKVAQKQSNHKNIN